MPARKFNAEILNAAIEGFEAQKSRIDARIAEIRQMLAVGRTGPGIAAEPQKRKRKMSAAARKRIGDAQRKRWAESKKQAESPSAPATREAGKPKRKLSAAGRKRIIEATKRRWAAVKTARQAQKPDMAKKVGTKAAS
jgi:hypothetical protein